MRATRSIGFAFVAAFVAFGGGSAQARELPCGCESSAQVPSGLSPAWSPDGKRIAYIQRHRGRYDVYVMNADGSHKRALTSTGDSADPSWSPDGRQIVFGRDDGESEGIYVVGADGSGLSLLTSANDSSEPSWSPDGRRIAFVGNSRTRPQIYVMNVDGRDVHPLVRDDQWDISPAWSPDGSRIAFTGGGEDEGYVDVVNADGSSRRRLTFSGADSSPAWSRTGEIAYTNWSDENLLLVMNADGSDPRPLLGESGASDWSAAWAPDGKRVAFVSDRDDTRQVYTAEVNGAALRRLTGVRRAFTLTGDRCTVVGTNHADVLDGTRFDDVICGLGGDDIVRGEGGNDVLDGGAGADVIVGGPGHDQLLGAGGADRLDARDHERDDVDGGAGDDRGRVDPGDWVRLLEHLL
jgi:dipeptidyl aminopeptidase/acylaminoacyl peptidase